MEVDQVGKRCNGVIGLVGGGGIVGGDGGFVLVRDPAVDNSECPFVPLNEYGDIAETSYLNEYRYIAKVAREYYQGNIVYCG